MLVQIPHDPERLPALVAAVGLLSAVKPQVCLQVVPQPEAFAALGAGVRPFPRVEPQMAAEALPQGKCLGALGAGVWPLPGVEALVSAKDLPPLERFPADVADVSVAGVCDHVLEAPQVFFAPREAAETMARVGTLMPAQVFGFTRAWFVVSVESFRCIVILHVWNFEQIDQLNSTRKQQLLI